MQRGTAFYSRNLRPSNPKYGNAGRVSQQSPLFNLPEPVARTAEVLRMSAWVAVWVGSMGLFDAAVAMSFRDGGRFRDRNGKQGSVLLGKWWFAPHRWPGDQCVVAGWSSAAQAAQVPERVLAVLDPPLRC